MARTVNTDDTQIIFIKQKQSGETVGGDPVHVDKLCTTKMNSDN